MKYQLNLKWIEMWIIIFQRMEYLRLGWSNRVRADLNRLVCWLIFFTRTQVLCILYYQSDSKPSFMGLRMMVMYEFCVFCLFFCFHNSKVGPKKTNIPGHFVILFELYRVWKVFSFLMYNRQRYHMSETNRPLRNGSMNVVRMRWPRKKGGPGDGTSGRVAKKA